MTELGKAYVQIIPSAKGISGSIQNQIGGEGIGRSVGGKIAMGMKAAIAAGAIGQFLKSTIMEGAELEQNLGGTEAVFGQFAKTIQTEADSAYKNMGLSASEYMSTANKMGSLFQGSGMEQNKALGLTTDAMQRAADVASVMGVDTSMAMESIAGAAKGNFTMMDNLGVAMNATTLEAYALEKGINFNWNTASQAEKSELAMKMFMDRTSQYAGNFAKESEETISGSIGQMQAAFSNFLGDLTLGKDIGPALSALSGAILSFGANIIPALLNVLTELPTAVMGVLAEIAPTIFPSLIDTVISLLTRIIENIPTFITYFIQFMQGLADGLIAALPTLIAALPTIINTLISNLLLAIPQLIQAGITLLTSLVAALPEIITQIAAALPEIINGIISTLLENLPLIIQCGIDLLLALITALPEIISAIAAALPDIISGIITALIDNLPLIIQCGIQLFIALIAALPQIIGTLVSAVPQIIGSLVSGLRGSVGEFISAGRDLLLGLGRGIANAVGSVIDMAVNAGKKIVGGIKDFFGINSPSRVFMEIGKFLDEGLALGIKNNTKVVSKELEAIANLTTGTMDSEIAVMARYSAMTAGSKFEEAGKVINNVEQIINVNQPVQTPYDLRSALRMEAITMGLAGA